MSPKRPDAAGNEGSHRADDGVAPSSCRIERDSKRLKTGNGGVDSPSCHVIERRLDYSMARRELPPSISLTPTLDDLMGGQIPSSEFLTSVFRKRAAHVTCTDSSQDDIHRRTRIGSLCKELYDLDVEALMRETSSDNIFIWLRDTRNGSPVQSTHATTAKERRTSDGLIRSIEVSDVDTAVALHKCAGHSCYFRAPPKVEQNLVASLLQATGLGCGQYDPSGDSMLCMGRGEVETFVSTPSHVTDWHYDFQDNYTIQLSGIKRWTLQQGTILDPLRACTPHYNSPEVVESQLTAAYLFDRKFVFGKPTVPTTAQGGERSVLMKPGDVLYFPAGMWHKVETVVPGMSINVSLMATNYATLVSQALSHFLYRDRRFREPVVNNSVTNATHNLRSLLKDLPEIVKRFSKASGEGSQDILPPVLQYPPRFIVPELEEDEEEEAPEEEVQIEEMEVGIGGNVEGNHDVDLDDNRENDSTTDASQRAVYDDDGEVFDPANFTSYPASWDFQLEMGSKIAMYKNPLGALHRREEITSFYMPRDEIKTSKQRPVFVLNVNYAGNQMHESAIRVVFCDNEEGLVTRLWHKERDIVDQSENSPLETCFVTENNHFLISFLVFHGFMQVKEV
jgi:Cupin superfamily protein